MTGYVPVERIACFGWVFITLATFFWGCVASVGEEEPSRLRPTREQRIITNERLVLGSGAGFAQSENFKSYGGLSSLFGGTVTGESLEMFGLEVGLARQFLQEEELLKGNETTP